MTLYPHQEEHVARAMSAGRLLLTSEMGLGKTLEAIAVCKRTDASNVLVVTPAIVRRAWLKELDKWWPEHPEVGIISCGRRTKLGKKAGEVRDAAFESPVQVVSYNLLRQIHPGPWDVIIFDEAHKLGDKAAWTKVARAIVQANRQAIVLGLTGTPIANEPAGAAGIFWSIWPDKFRSVWKFKQHFANASHNGYGWEFKGLNPLHAGEFKRLLDASSARTTKREVAHLMPAFTVQHRDVPQGSNKILAIKDWIETNRAEVPHLMVLTHRRQLAKDLAREVGALCITGETPAEQRHDVLNQAVSAPNSIVCATMHALGIGIDLTAFRAVAFAELYWRPETLVQALGRFHRLSSQEGCTVALFSENELDERIAYKISEKLDNIGAAVKHGEIEESLADAIMGDVDLQKDLSEAIANMRTDPYLD